MGHARPVHLGVDVADQIGLQIEILDQRKRMIGRGTRGVPLQHLDRPVALQLAAHALAEQGAAHAVVQHRHAVEVGLDRAAGERLQRRFRAQRTRRPVGFGVELPEQPEQRAAQIERHPRADPLLVDVPAIAAVAAEVLVAAVAGQCDLHRFAGELAHPIGGYGRTVRVGLVVDVGQPVEQRVVVRVDLLDVMSCRIALRNFLARIRLR